MMQVRSVEFTSIEAKRLVKQGERLPNVRIDNNSAITSVVRGDGDTATIDFRFTVNYSGVGYIKIEGSIHVEEGVDAIVTEWAKSGAMPHEDANMIHNIILSNCMVSAVLLSREIKLMPPIPMPRVNMQKPPGKQGASSGMEVA
jgi:hypothetical protein